MANNRPTVNILNVGGTEYNIGASGDGHSIQNEDGTTMLQRTFLQFEGAEVTDNEEEDKTVVKTKGGHQIKKGGTSSILTQRDILEFSGDIVDIVDNSTSNKTTVKLTAPGIKTLHADTVGFLKQTIGHVNYNLLKYPYAETTQTKNGLTFTDNGDGTITVNGTATADTEFILNQNMFNGDEFYEYFGLLSDTGTSLGTVVPMPNISSVGDTAIAYRIYNSTGNIAYNIPNKTGVLSIAYFKKSNSPYKMVFFVVSGTTLSNAVIKPYLGFYDGKVYNKEYALYADSAKYGPFIRKAYKSLDAQNADIIDDVDGVNLLKITATTQTINGVTFTVNDDGSVTVNGTATTNIFNYVLCEFERSDFEKINGCIFSGLNYDTDAVQLNNTYLVNGAYKDEQKSPNPYRINVPDDNTITSSQFKIRISSGAIINNLTIYPMLRKADILDDTYRPYKPTAIKHQLSVMQNLYGAKNLLKNTAVTQTFGGITYTINADKSVTINGTATGSGASLNLWPDNENYRNSLSSGNKSRLYLAKGTYILSGGVDNPTQNASIIPSLLINNLNGVSSWKVAGPELVFTITDDTKPITVGIYVEPGLTASNLTFYPMIRPAEIEDDTYEPYAMTNQELTDWSYINESGSARANSNIKIYNLGTSFTDEMSADIRSGRFDLVRTGGYITINDHKYYMAHADYLLHTGSTSLETHHMLVIPEKPFYNHVMEDTNITTNGYLNSKMKKEGLTSALATIKADFGESHILTYRDHFINAAIDGIPTGNTEQTSQCDLMNEHMVYGGPFFQPLSNGTKVPTIWQQCKTQLALFQACPDLINPTRWGYWLRDVVSSTVFAIVGNAGATGHGGASLSFGVRPFFLIY